MKKYDKVYVPDDMLGPFEASDIRSGNPERGRLYKLEDKIVLSMEEAEYLFAAGAMYGAKRYHPDWEDRPDFKLYMQSKGIQIP